MFFKKKQQENEVYLRFKRLSDEVNGLSPFRTKLGIRSVECNECLACVYFTYYDKDNTPLFVLQVKKDGKIDKIFSKIDDVAIFSAIYEIECLIYKETIKSDLSMLFKNNTVWYGR